VVAAYERSDGVERQVYLAGERHDIDLGDALTASGTLRVIEHAEAKVNGVTVPDAAEVRVEQPRIESVGPTEIDTKTGCESAGWLSG